MTEILDKLLHLEKLAVADTEGNPKAHGELLKGIGELFLAAETPIETTSRLNFQVRTTHHCPDMLRQIDSDQVLQPAAAPKHMHSNRGRERLATCNRCKGWSICHCNAISYDNRDR